MSPECSGELVDIVETKGYIAAIGWHPDGTKKIVPDTERDTVIDAVATLRELFGMVPYVHLWTVEDISQRTKRKIEVGMIQVTDCQREQMHQDKIRNAEAYHGQRNVLKRAVNECFTEVVAQVRGESHFPDGMVYLVYFPQKWHPVKQPVNIPLDKITGNEQREQLGPVGPGCHIQRH